MTIQFKPGDRFKLTPRAKISWLVFTVYGPSSSAIRAVRAVRCDSKIGKSLLDWIAQGKPSPHPYKTVEVYEVAQEFYVHDLETAVAV